MAPARSAQLAYSESQALMLDETSRRAKARKMARVVEHFLGRDDLRGLRVIDVGCSGGIVADELRRAGAAVVGLDIDRPGIAKAQARFAPGVAFVAADSQRLPLRGASADVVICNHVYEHVVDAEALVSELKRVTGPGVLYLGLGNRLGIMEPHYRLPFLSWLPRRLADRYVRAMGKATYYHESFRTRGGLRRLFAGLQVWDYTFAVLAEPDRFDAGAGVPSWAAHLPAPMMRAATPFIPTYLWVATAAPTSPRGPALPTPPKRLTT